MSVMRSRYGSRLLIPHLPCWRLQPINVRQASQTAAGESQDRSIQPAPKSGSSDPSAQKPGDSQMIRQEGAADGMVNHRPHFRAPIDHGTSQFSPVPYRVIDGSEEGDMTPAAILSGAPVDLQARTVRIFRPAKTATQSGHWHGHQWRMDWDILQKGHRWENPLMGWQSSGDYMQGTHLNFKSKDDAIMFAQKQGYEYFVQEPNERRIIPKAYANNFSYSHKRLKQIPTK